MMGPSGQQLARQNVLPPHSLRMFIATYVFYSAYEHFYDASFSRSGIVKSVILISISSI